jgi:hypothetical protein
MQRDDEYTADTVLTYRYARGVYVTRPALHGRSEVLILCTDRDPLDDKALS